MHRYQRLGMQLRLKRVEVGLHQKALGVILGGATQRLIHLWEVGRCKSSPRYLRQVNEFLSLDPLALISFAGMNGLQESRKPKGDAFREGSTG